MQGRPLSMLLLVWSSTATWHVAISSAQDVQIQFGVAAGNQVADELSGQLAQANDAFQKKKFDECIKRCTKILEQSADNATALHMRGNAEYELGKYARAIADFEQVLQLEPKNLAAGAKINLAWIHSTCPDSKFRNGAKAVKLAHEGLETLEADERLGPSARAAARDTVAAAHAEKGEFKKAEEWQTKAIEDAPMDDRANFEARLAIYRHKLPFREDKPTKTKHPEGEPEKPAPQANLETISRPKP